MNSKTIDGLTPLDIVRNEFGEDHSLFQLLLDYDDEPDDDEPEF